MCTRTSIVLHIDASQKPGIDMEEQKCNLFVYGSLRDASVFQSVCGLYFTVRPSQVGHNVLLAELALLANHRRVSPDNVYFYAVPDPSSKIEGVVIYDVPASAMAEIDRYEGQLHDRETVHVNTAGGLVEAQAYLASPKRMKKRFGDRFHVNLIHELWLRKRIEKFFETHTRPGEKSHDADVERRARRQLLGTTERDLVVSHLHSDVVSDYYLEHELNRPILSIRHLYQDAEVAPYVCNYLALVVKQAVLNRLEDILQSRYRYELDRLCPSRRYYTRSGSILAALRMIDTNTAAVDMMLRRCLETMPPDGRYDLIDYVKYGVAAAESIFDPRMAASEIERIRANAQPGLIPMGAELEFSNLGFKAVDEKSRNADAIFAGFKYFNDFGLDVLMWKLGGYIDDNTGRASPRRQGFLELAPGRLNIAGEVSKPATGDPWLMNQLIREIAAFYPVRPHSLHLSFQIMRHRTAYRRVLPLSFVKCLLVLGGGTQESATGRLWISRMQHDEIKQNIYGEELVFSRISKRSPRLSRDEIGEKWAMHGASLVQQYKFIRLDPRANYEPLIMALKGLQMAYNPADYLTAQQLAESPKLQRQYAELKEWSINPTEISHGSRTRFLETIREGLMQEAHWRPYHRLHYIDWAVDAIDIQLRLFNKHLRQPPAAEAGSQIRKLLDSFIPFKLSDH